MWEGLTAPLVNSSAENLHSCSIKLQSHSKQLSSCLAQQGISLTTNVAGEIIPSMCPQVLILLPELQFYKVLVWFF